MYNALILEESLDQLPLVGEQKSPVDVEATRVSPHRENGRKYLGLYLHALPACVLILLSIASSLPGPTRWWWGMQQQGSSAYASISWAATARSTSTSVYFSQQSRLDDALIKTTL